MAWHPGHFVGLIQSSRARQRIRDDFGGGDKALHLLACTGLSLGVTMITRKPLAGFLTTAAIGLGKEVIDSRRRGQPINFPDLITSNTGAMLGSGTGFGVLKFTKGQRVVPLVMNAIFR